MKRIILALWVLALVAVAVPAAQANHSWGGYHWARPANPFSLTAVKSITSEWTTAVAGSVSDWSASTMFDLTTTQGSTTSKDRKRCVAVSGQIRVCNAAYGFNGWLGVAEIWLNGSHIVQARTRLNDSYFSTSTYNKPVWRNFVACQEIGHDFGLDHQDTNFDNPNLGTCMDYTNDPTTNQHPNAHDYEELQIIYGSHVDSAASANSSVSSAPQPKGDDDVKVEKDGQYTKVTFILHAHQH